MLRCNIWGDESGVSSLAFLNNMDITGGVVAGQILALPDVVNKRKVKVLKDGGHLPATNYNNAENEGIEYWDLEGDFIVS